MIVLPAFDPPEADPLAAPFWDAVQRDAVALPRCSVCGRWQWYPEPSGTDCAGGELVWEDVATTGTVYTFTRVHRSFLPRSRDQDPYLVGSVELDGVDGPKLVANFADDPRLDVGARVQARFEDVDGRRHPVFVVTSDGSDRP